MSQALTLCFAIAFGTLAVAAPVAAQPPADEARELYRKGARLYNLGQFEAALEAFEQAYSISGAKPLLFNIAQAHRLAGPGHCERALAAYSGYLREEPDTSNAEEVRQRIEEMKVCAERETAQKSSEERAASVAALQPVPAPPPPMVPSSPAPTRSLAPVATTLTGAALALTGGVLYWRARVKFDEVEASCPCAEGQFAGWQAATTTSYALMAVGSTALVGGAIWWALDRKHAKTTSYGLTLRPGGLGLFGVF